ncbi:MAG TPA: pyridoxamine 5'-phosphate oxidase family protein [Anaerolineales bacterium]|nr:pyridoxamine 5'-phosphate oxidase family protein [Anaerolineales bacterium]
MTYPKTPRSKLKRLAERGRYDKETVHAVLDAGRIAHVGIAPDGEPVVIPVLYARLGDEIVFHGALASRLLKFLAGGGPVCVTVTIVDGLVLARSLFEHSMNYRSVVAFGRGRLLEDGEKLAALHAISEHLLPGRWDDARRPTPKELKATTVIAVAIEEATAKIRTGGPKDYEADYALPVWAGVIPLHEASGVPEPDERLADGIMLPPYLERILSIQSP